MAGHERPSTGSTLNAGVGFSAPYLLVLTGGHSVPSSGFDSLAGSSGGSWDDTLDPFTTYSRTLSVANITAFSSPRASPRTAWMRSTP